MTAPQEEAEKELPQYNALVVEQSVIDFWKKHKTFEKSITTRSEDQPYRFYDGPPFITGLPHYGSLLSSVVKDVMTRFWTQKGKRIDRVRGRDCHGIYVEQKVQEKLGYTSNKDIEEKGIEGFIRGCYDFTKDVSDQRDWYVDHIGRWVDFKNAYKTMDNTYMESVLWVFKSLWDKGLVYKGKRVSLYSTKLNTPISNYEVALDNSYADISDPAITVKFPVQGAHAMQLTDKTSSADAFEITEDGFVHTVIGVIQDAAGRYLSIYNTKREMWTFPGGKVDKGETPEQALVREIQEEIGVTPRVGEKLGTRKIIMHGKLWCASLYQVHIDETPALQEKVHTLLDYATVAPCEKTAENTLGYEYSIAGSVISDTQEIMRFPALYLLLSVLPQLPEEAASAPMSLLAWTTTPWTIPANVALAVHPDMWYVQIFDFAAKEYFILAENLVGKYYKHTDEYCVVTRTRGQELLGVRYQPPFSHYADMLRAQPQYEISNNYAVVGVEYVTDSDGTGIVHTAPEFGEEDFATGRQYNLLQTEALDAEGKYTSQVPAYTGMYYRDMNDRIMQDMKDSGALVKKESITHAVAMCPRTDVPLIYKAQDARFINIQVIKELLFANNEKVHWVPEHLKHGRFLKSMESAPDRCISRTRYRATPMPVWRSATGDIIVVGSLEEIYDLDQTGSKIMTKRGIPATDTAPEKTIYRDVSRDTEFDLHRPYIDAVRGMKQDSEGILQKYTRISEVLDPRLESGSMPYAQVHYPFENKEKFEQSFPADYVAEYVGQVRARFFFMHALATMLSMPKKCVTDETGISTLLDDTPVLSLPEKKYNSPAFSHVVCTGVLAGTDGRKMSKSLGNYPDPKETMETYGGDVLRLYLCASPIVVGGDMNFSEDGLKEAYKKCILPLRNSYYFYTTYAGIDSFVPGEHTSLRDLSAEQIAGYANPLDRWMIMKTMELGNSVHDALVGYDMQAGATAVIRFMDHLTNRYIRRSRRRFWENGSGDQMGQDKRDAYCVLHAVLAEICLIAAPFIPCITEYIYQKITGKESVHLEYTGTYDVAVLDTELLTMMGLTQRIVSLGLSLRGQKKLRVKQPLPAVLVSVSLPALYQHMICEELNVKELRINTTLGEQVRAICKPDAKILGKKFGKDMQRIIVSAKNGEFVIQENGHAIIAGEFDLAPEEFTIEYEKGTVAFDVAIDGSLIVALDDTLTDALRLEGDARDLIRYIQEARKTVNYNLDDRIHLAIAFPGAIFPEESTAAKDAVFPSDIHALLGQFGELIAGETLATIQEAEAMCHDPDFKQMVELDTVGPVAFCIKR